MNIEHCRLKDTKELLLFLGLATQLAHLISIYTFVSRNEPTAHTSMSWTSGDAHEAEFQAIKNVMGDLESINHSFWTEPQK